MKKTNNITCNYMKEEKAKLKNREYSEFFCTYKYNCQFKDQNQKNPKCAYELFRRNKMNSELLRKLLINEDFKK